jgi:hypothetical protein
VVFLFFEKALGCFLFTFRTLYVNVLVIFVLLTLFGLHVLDNAVVGRVVALVLVVRSPVEIAPV